MKTMKFKPSEVGPVPVDWEVKRLGGCCKKIGSGATPTGGATVYLSHGVSLIRSQNVYNGYFKYEGLAHITDSAASALDGVTVQDDDVLLNITGDSVARCTKVPADVLPARVNQHVAIIRTCSEELGSDYLQCYLASPDMQTYMLNAASGQGGSRNAMTKGMVEDFQIPIPPLPEQKAIAEALSDVDALLSAMTKLIEKKHAIKQGAMQQLLTGKKRLAGFTGKWVEKRLGDVCELNPPGGGIPDRFVYIDLESVVDGALIGRKIVEKCCAPSRAQRRFKRGDILFQTVRPYQKNNLFVDFEAARYVASTGYAVLRGLPGIGCSAFVYYVLHTDGFTGEVLDRCTGTSYPAINPGKLAEITLRLPQEVVEQQAIAAVLSDMDAEIAVLESKRAKYESIKQGMMQELLTGRVRLV